ncbi:MAG: hypothetical protein PHE48_01335 [Candidatus Daviesbacteria bacterium]|nr:hypothetical protein [Candidatus Daviesbacteria bacterium]
MSKVKEIRFCVGSKNKMSSLVWKMFINNEDVYLLARQMGGSWKISLHKSGICRVAFKQELEKGKDRLVLKWDKVYVEDTISPNIAILVPHVDITKALNKNIESRLNKDILYIDSPSNDEKVVVKVFYTKNDGVDLESKLPASHKKLFQYALKNGEVVYLIAWKEKLQDAEITQLRDQVSKFQVNVTSEEAKSKIDTVFAVWINEGTQQTHQQPTIVNYPLGYEHLKVSL